MMFKKCNLKKFVSILMTALMLLASVPSFADTASDSTQIYYTDFSDLKNEGFTGVSTATTNIATGTDGIKTYVTNADVANSDGKRAMATIAEDNTYGTTLVLTKEGLSAKSLCFDVRVTPDASKNIVIKTAVKRTTSMAEADAYIGISNYKFLRFAKNGDLYVNEDAGLSTSTTAGKYELDTWYDIVIEYSSSTKFAMVTIDGGIYENTTLYCDEITGVDPGTLNFAFANQNSSTTNVNIADLHIGYIDIEEHAPKSLSNLELDSYITLDGLGVSGANETLSASQYKSLGLSANSYSVKRLFLRNVDSAHGVSLAFDLSEPRVQSNTNYWDASISYSLAEPYGTVYSDGAFIVEYSVYMNEGMQTYCSTTFEEKGNLPTATYNYTTPVKVGYNWPKLSIEADKWYNIMRIADFDGGIVSTVVYNPANPSQYHVMATDDLSQSGAIKSLSFNVASDGASPDAACGYIDNINVYTTADLAFESSYPVKGTEDFDIYSAVSLTYNAPVTSANVVVKNGGETVDSSLYNVIYAGKSVIVEPKVKFEETSDYTVTVTGATDVFGNMLSDSQTLNFTTCEEIFTASYKILNADDNDAELNPAQLKAGDKIKVDFTIGVNTTAKIPMIHAVGIYDAATNELKNLLFYNRDLKTSMNVVTHQNHIMTLEEGTYIRIFAWNRDTNAPLMDAITLNVNK